MERGRFTARTAVDVPEQGISSTSTYTVDLDRGLARASTTATMRPTAGASTSWTPRTGDPVVHWVIGDRLLIQLPDDGGARGWVSAPDTPLLGSGLSLLLWPAGVIKASGAQGASGAISAVVDLGEVIERAPASHAAGVAQLLEELSLTADDRVAVEITITDGALTQIGAEVVTDLEGEPTRRVVHLSVDHDVPSPLSDPPDPQEKLDAGELVRRVEANVPGGPQWWTRTRPLRV